MDTTSAGAMHEVATGQRLMILAIVVNIVAYIVANAVEPILGLMVGLGAAVSAEATKALRANGYKVGFFGAKDV